MDAPELFEDAVDQGQCEALAEAAATVDGAIAAALLYTRASRSEADAAEARCSGEAATVTIEFETGKATYAWQDE